MDSLYIRGMMGLGDNFYQRPIIGELSKSRKVILTTPWPQIYVGLKNVECFPLRCSLRMQKRNAEQFPFPNSVLQRGQKLNYTSYLHSGNSIWMGLCKSVSMDPEKYWLAAETLKNRKPIAVVRPATIRKEWIAASRNPKQKYIQYAVDYLKASRLTVIVVAAIEKGEEWWDGDPIQNADKYYINGELGFVELWKLFAQATIVVSPVGFAAPMGMYNSVPTVIIHGGCGGYNNPSIIDAPTWMSLIHVVPKKYCMCKTHYCSKCDKTIEVEDLERGLEAALAR